VSDLLAHQPNGGNERLLFREAASLLAADLSLGELFERLTTMLPSYLDSSVVFIALARDDGRHAIEYIYDHGEIRRYPHIRLSERSRALAVMTTGEVIWGNHPSVWAPEGRAPINRDRPWTNDTLSAIFVPMRAGGRMVGCLSVQSVNENAYTADEVDTIAAIGHYLGVAVQNQRTYQTLQRSAEYDALTSLPNHSRILRELDAALARATDEEPLAVVMLDIINFECFNETYGQSAADDVVRQIARTLRRFEDDYDGVTAGRFGSGVFLVLVRASDANGVRRSVTRLHKMLAELAYVASDQTLPIATGCGYALVPSELRDRAALLSLCEDRMRRSRNAGGSLVGSEGGDTYAIRGDFDGIRPIVEALLERDPFTRVHLLQVNALAAEWAQTLALDEAQHRTFLRASLLHDAGKLIVSDRLLKKPGRLGSDEFDAMKLHAEYGKHILMQHAGYEDVARIAAEHHERWDGTGYPRQLLRDQIHPLARALAILDAFSAMVAHRPYHRGVSLDAALAELQRCAGTQFDPLLVERFVAWFEEGNLPLAD
jgi:diguanylate cyclase (GGDEF)-like protein